MNKYFGFTLAFLFLTFSLPKAEDHFGLGLVFGAPSGISAKIPVSTANSLNMILGYNLYGRKSSVTMIADYVWYQYDIIPITVGKLPLYFGPGATANFSDGASIGVRAVIGAEYQFATVPFDAFLELGPGINVIPNTNGYFTIGLGARYLF